MRIEADWFENGTWRHDSETVGTIGQWREDNFGDDETLAALDRLEKGEIDEAILGGGAASLMRLRVSRFCVRLIGKGWLRTAQGRSFETTTNRDESMGFVSIPHAMGEIFNLGVTSIALVEEL